MTVFMSAFHDVWSAAAIITAVVGGLVVGALIAQVSRVPAGVDARSVAVIVVLAATLFAAVFWVGQVTEAFVGGDPAWPRALARAVLQLGYGVFTGIGFYAGVVIQRRRSSE